MDPIYSELINSSFGDAGVVIDIGRGREYVLFDCGNLINISPKKIFKVTDIFISHAHMDHIFGFDWVFRIFIGSPQTLNVFGPPGLSENIFGKLSGYTWNIKLDNELVIQVFEIFEHELVRHSFSSNTWFTKTEPAVIPLASNIIKDTPTYQIICFALNHKIPSLSYTFLQKTDVHIKKEALETLCIPSGPWLRQIKEVFACPEKNLPIEISGKTYDAQQLAQSLCEKTQGTKIAYITDALYEEERFLKLMQIIRGSDILYCEAPFLKEDLEKAQNTYHLTAQQAGEIARKAQVKALCLFHFGKAYHDRYKELVAEAKAEFDTVRFYLKRKPNRT